MGRRAGANGAQERLTAQLTVNGVGVARRGRVRDPFPSARVHAAAVEGFRAKRSLDSGGRAGDVVIAHAAPRCPTLWSTRDRADARGALVLSSRLRG